MEFVKDNELERDRKLIEFETYEDYLDSLITPVDLCYLQSTSTAREIARLGYRCTGKTYDEKMFYQRRKVVKNFFYPERTPYILASERIITLKSSVLERELAFRERANRLYILSTIIFVRILSKRNLEISAYIDYAHRLKTEDWVPFFQGKRKLRPLKSDLSYYNWRTGEALFNNTFNYEPFIDTNKGLMFKNLHDGKLINTEQSATLPSEARVFPLRIYDLDNYEHIMLYDHVLRGKMQIH